MLGVGLYISGSTSRGRHPYATHKSSSIDVYVLASLVARLPNTLLMFLVVILPTFGPNDFFPHEVRPHWEAIVGI